MNTMVRLARYLAMAAILAAPAFAVRPAVAADSFGAPAPGAPFASLVPVSAFTRAASWLDPTKLHFSTSVSVGSGFAGGTTGLQVTSLSYRFRAPLAMSVSVGNTFGPAAARGGQSLFLEGLDLAYRPTSSMIFELRYKDYRSPLQYGSSFGIDPFYLR